MRNVKSGCDRAAPAEAGAAHIDERVASFGALEWTFRVKVDLKSIENRQEYCFEGSWG